jgi:site-specific DNA-methyltransferase (adenine-specific)
MMNNEQNPQLTIPRVIGCLSFFNADNLEIMRGFADNEFDLAIVDPPYGLGIDGQKGDVKKGVQIRKAHSFKGWDNAIPTAEYFAELKRVSKNQIIWGANYFTEFLPPTKAWIFWYKGQQDLTMSDGEMAWTSLDKVTRMVNIHRTHIWQEKPMHPTQKPVKLYDWILNKYATEGMKILDTHLGSGSIAIAVEKANRLDKMNLQFVGIEIDKEYFEKALNRIEQYTRQGTLSF